MHEQAFAELSASPFPGADPNAVFPDEWHRIHRFGVIRQKYSRPRFLNVHMVPPFTPHSGGSLFPPADLSSPMAGTPSGLGLTHS